MKVQALILVLLVPCFVHAAPQYYGSRMGRLSLSGTDSQADLELVSLKPGDVITSENVRTAIQTLYNTGRYSYIEVDATTAADGSTDLNFRVRPVYFFSTFRLEPENLLERSVSGYLRLPFGERFTTSAIDRIVQDTTELLRSEGYFEATVMPRFTYDEANYLVFVTLAATPGPRATVRNIRIQGGEETFTDKSELFDALGLESGEAFSAANLQAGMSEIRTRFIDLGFLNTRVTDQRSYDAATNGVDLDITIQPGQFTLVLTVDFEIPDRRLRELVPVYEEGAVDTDLVEEGRTRIERYLQEEGYFEPVVKSEIIKADPSLGDAVQINYIIMSGTRHRIDSVRIEGNRHFETDEIRRRIKTRRAELLNRGSFSPDLLEDDKRAIEIMYRNAGFQGTVVNANYEESPTHTISVVFRIEEGRQVPIDFITLIGNSEVTNEEIQQALGLKEGDTYTPVAVEQSRAAITQLYYARGHADVRVEVNVDRVESNHGMRVTFQIAEGPSYRIGRILVAGNTRTQEKIIHRNFSTPESNLFPGLPYNPEAVLQGQQRLYATGLFTRVEIVTLQQNVMDVRNLLIQVEDAPPILVTYGVGYQEFERVRATIDLSHNNLFGQDRSISFRVRGSQRQRLFQSTYREPKLFNWNFEGFGSFFVEHTERPFFTANRIDFSLQVLKRLSAQRNFLVTTGYQTVNQGDIRVNPLAEKLPAERGVFQIARVGGSFIQDHRNDPVNPSSGSFTTTTFQVASRVLGSELNFTSLYNLFSIYTPVPYGVLATSTRLGWNHPFGGTVKLPPTERYFAGGSTTLRGFDLDEARPGGGHVMTIANFEYRAPLRWLPIDGIGAALFYDTGNVFPSVSDVHLRDFTHTAGFGLRYQTPLGPVRIDFGVNLKPRLNQDGKKEERVQVFFTLGNPF